MRPGVASALLALLGALGCGTSRFGAASDGGGSGSSGTSGGGLGGGGSAGAGAGGAGSGGAGAPSCSCAVGQYCRGGSCRDCSDLSSIQFDAPQMFLDHPSADLRFPRQGGPAASLFYTVATAQRSELWYSADVLGQASAPIGDAQDPSRLALLYLDNPGSLSFDAVFGEATDAQLVVRSASWDGSTLGNVASLSSPLSPGGFDTYSVAVASSTRRAYWMSTRDGGPSLRTGTFGSGNDDVLDVTLLARDGTTTCPRTGDDATPWVTPSGNLMLLRAPALDSGCLPVDGAATDLYAVALDASTGRPLTPAAPLGDVNQTSDESSESDPSFSRDLCDLVFVSDGGAAEGHDFRLFRAHRR